MTVTGRLGAVIFDAPDIDALADFYARLTGWTVDRREPDWVTLHTDAGQELAFQLAPDHVPPQWPSPDHPQQAHLDLLVEGREAAAERAVALGATRLAEGASWITLADPAGHPFDLCEKEGVGPGMQLYAATFDTADASGLARFYAGLLGMEVTYDGAEGALVTGGGHSLMFQQVDEHRPPAWPDPARPQQAHLDVFVDDLDAAETLATDLGATRLPAGDEKFRVFADPSGHPFCLCL